MVSPSAAALSLVASLALSACGGQTKDITSAGSPPADGTGGAFSIDAGSRSTDAAPGTLPITLPTDPGPSQPDCYTGQPLGCTGYTETSGKTFGSSPPYLDIVSIYESHGIHGACSPVGVFYVDVAGAGEHVLALSSFEPVHWVVQADADATIKRVILLGYWDSDCEVDAPIVEDRTYTAGDRSQQISATTYPSNDADALIRQSEAATNILTSSIWTAYCGNRATILDRAFPGSDPR